MAESRRLPWFIICEMCRVTPERLSNRNFLMMSCGHLFCSNCAQSGWCPGCRSAGRSLSVTDAGASKYFQTVQKSLEPLRKVLEFQSEMLRRRAQSAITEQHRHEAFARKKQRKLAHLHEEYDKIKSEINRQTRNPME